MAKQVHQSPIRGDKLPKPYANMAAVMRPGLVQAVRDAVASGDAPAATYFYRAVAGPGAAKRLSQRNALAELKNWLVQEP